MIDGVIEKWKWDIACGCINIVSLMSKDLLRNGCCLGGFGFSRNEAAGIMQYLFLSLLCSEFERCMVI